MYNVSFIKFINQMLHYCQIVYQPNVALLSNCIESLGWEFFLNICLSLICKIYKWNNLNKRYSRNLFCWDNRKESLFKRPADDGIISIAKFCSLWIKCYFMTYNVLYIYMHKNSTILSLRLWLLWNHLYTSKTIYLEQESNDFYNGDIQS